MTVCSDIVLDLFLVNCEIVNRYGIIFVFGQPPDRPRVASYAVDACLPKEGGGARGLELK